MQVPSSGQFRPGSSEMPGIGMFLHGGTTPCSVGSC